MTNEEIAYALEAYPTDLEAVPKAAEGERKFRTALALAIKTLKSAEKYKWHDLRKDPKDLPTPFTQVLIYCICDKLYDSAEEIYTTTIYSDNSANFLVSNRVVKEIIAWRYIEPFTEDE